VNLRQLATLVALLGCAAPARGQSGDRLRPLPLGYGSLTQEDLALDVRNGDLDIRLVPLDPALAPLLAPDAYQSLRGLLETNRRAIDSVAAQAGVAQPGLALVRFFGLRPDVRFDAQLLTLLIRSQVARPIGVIPVSGRFTSGQLGVREQAIGIYLFDQEIPVNDSFTLSYGTLTSSNWDSKQTTLNRERARVASRSRGVVRDTSRQKREQ
jgi:hypothetical protein